MLSNWYSFRVNQELIKELSTPAPGSEDLHFPTTYSQPFLIQCKACFWKQHWSYWRNPQYNAVRFLITIAIASLLGIVFWNKGQQTYVNLSPSLISLIHVPFLWRILIQ